MIYHKKEGEEYVESVLQLDPLSQNANTRL